MATGPRYSVKYRRRRDGKTDYRKRLNLLKSRKPRIVIRKSNMYIYAQLVQYDDSGDKTLATASSKELGKLGWKHSLKNLPAAYLTGMLLGKKIKKLNIKECIIDLGKYTQVIGSRLYSAVKGLADSEAIHFEYDEKIFPKQERLIGKHILKEKDLSTDFETIRKKLKE